jgi:hypothetical protein
MEGLVASWYARISRADASDVERTADMIAARLPPAAHILEVAPAAP